MMPAPPRICWKTVMTSTQEKKCGRYRTAWTSALSRGLSTLLTSRASAIGTGKKRTSWRRKRTRVFSTACQNPGSAKTRSNWARPTQGLSSMAVTPLVEMYGS